MTATPMVGSTFFGLDISQFAARLLSIRRKISKRVLIVEFRPDSLLLAEATLTQLGVQLSHISSVPLPPEALDRGVPAEPLKMAGLIQDFCSVNKIPAHRVAVVLPPELAFQRLLDLPASLSTDEAREYVLNPANGLQIPFPLTQTDFDLFPVLMPVEQQAGDKRTYMLTAIPEVLVDPIVEMLQAADLELQLLELGSHSQLRNHAADLITLSAQQVDLVLELLPDCSNLMLVSCSGLLGSERLASIRNPPEIALEADQRALAVSSGVLAEDLLFKDESYLPLSDLDLRVLLADLRSSLENFHFKRPDSEIRRVILTGVNSSHPLLADLLSETLSIPVVVSHHAAVTGLMGLSMDDLLLQSGLGRLTGLALGLLPNNQLLACSLEEQALDGPASQNQNDAVAIADLLGSSEAQTGLDLVAVEASNVGVSSEPTTDHLIPAITTTFEEVNDLDLDVEIKSDPEIDVANQPDLLPSSLERRVDPGEPSSVLPIPVSFNEDAPDIILDEKPLDALSQGELPLIASSATEHQSDIKTLDETESSNEQWPSITTPEDAVGDEAPFLMESDILDDFSVDPGSSFLATSLNEDCSLPEMMWPSISSPKMIDDDVEDVVVGLDESEWPSISSNPMQESIPSSTLSENPESLIPINENFSQATDADLTFSVNTSVEKSDGIEQLNVESPLSEILSTESTHDNASQAGIPGLDLIPEIEEDDKESVPKPPVSKESDPTDALQELGELRFADEN